MCALALLCKLACVAIFVRFTFTVRDHGEKSKTKVNILPNLMLISADDLCGQSFTVRKLTQINCCPQKLEKTNVSFFEFLELIKSFIYWGELSYTNAICALTSAFQSSRITPVGLIAQKW